MLTLINLYSPLLKDSHNILLLLLLNEIGSFNLPVMTLQYNSSFYLSYKNIEHLSTSNKSASISISLGR
jgi:hypothetical protein